jgi:SAM-dependent methyltransferase
MPVVDLGLQPLANSLKATADGRDEVIPLSVSFCPESGLLQLDQTVDRSVLFDQYFWVTGTSVGANRWATQFVASTAEAASLNARDLVIEIASNDGTFLGGFKRLGYENVLGVEPAQNIAEIANNAGLETIPKFWDAQLAGDIAREYGKASLVIARNVIAHMSDLLGAIEGVARVLKDDGLGVIEFHYAGDILQGLQYDSIYHEHLCYFSLKSFSGLLKRFDLHSYHVMRSPISGGALAVFFSKANHPITREQLNQERYEANLGLAMSSVWERFAARITHHKNETKRILETFRDQTVVGFGSSARSQTYLNYCGLGLCNISAIIDNNPMKQGMYTAGGSIPIVALKEGLALSPDIIFVLAWNFLDEIVVECKNAGFVGRYLIAFPDKIACINGH